MSGQSMSSAAKALLNELSVIPQVVGYDHRIAELDKAGFIKWRSGEGYFISAAGRTELSRLRTVARQTQERGE